MNSDSLKQLNLFLIFFVSGVIIGVLFDIFRIIRRSFKVSDFHTYIEDVLFGILTGLFLIFIIFVYNNGNIRFYMFVALILGAITYLLTISEYFIKINVKIITLIKKVIFKILHFVTYPFILITKFIKKILHKPFMLLVINLEKIKKGIRSKKEKKVKKIISKRKDFST